jgi:hypothetical protein
MLLGAIKTGKEELEGDYELSAIIGFEAVLSCPTGRFMYLRTARLNEGLALIPVTRELLNELAMDKKFSLNKKLPNLGQSLVPRNLTPPLVAYLAELSGFTPAAYVEANYRSGVGDQLAILWQADKIILGPLSTTWGKFGQPFNKFRMEDMAINCALRRMGVRATKQQDEFDIVGLDRQRTTETWC